MKRSTLDAILFLPAMAGVALVLFLAFWLIVKGGNAAIYAWHALFRALGLPFPAAMALTVIAAALSVYGAFYWLSRRRSPFRPSR